MIFLTTTAIDLDEELQNRCLTLSVDESAGADGAHPRAAARAPHAGGPRGARLSGRSFCACCATRSGSSRRSTFSIPTRRRLTFPTARTRNRRDHEKYLTLIDVDRAPAPAPAPERTLRARGPHARIHRGHPGRHRARERACARSPRPLARRTAAADAPVLGHIRTLMRGEARRSQGVDTFTRRELRGVCGWSLTQSHPPGASGRTGIFRGPARPYGQPVCLRDPDRPRRARDTAHVGLIDVESLKTHAYKVNLAGLGADLAGGGGWPREV